MVVCLLDLWLSRSHEGSVVSSSHVVGRGVVVVGLWELLDGVVGSLKDWVGCWGSSLDWLLVVGHKLDGSGSNDEENEASSL